jgi:hypothetical protein
VTVDLLKVASTYRSAAEPDDEAAGGRRLVDHAFAATDQVAAAEVDQLRQAVARALDDQNQ